MNLIDVLSLNFYDLVTLEVRAPRQALNFLRSEWGGFEAAAADNQPDIVVTFAPRGSRRRALISTRVDHIASGWYKGCLWRATSLNRNGSQEVEYSSIPRSNFLFRDSCLEPLLLSALESRGLHSLHASSACIDDSALVFAGPPRSGKTILGLIASRRGYPLLSDDVTLIGDGLVYHYSVPPRVYLHNHRYRELFGEYAAQSVSTDSIPNFLMSLATLGQLRIPSRIMQIENSPHPPKLHPPSKLGGLFVLNNAEAKPGVKRCSDGNLAVKRVVENLPNHGGSILAHFRLDQAWTELRSRALDSAVRLLVEVEKVFEVTTSRRMNARDWKEVFEEIVRVAAEPT